MKPDPILEELWRVKDALAREADYDIARIFAELSAAESRHPGPLIRTAEELQRNVAEQQQRRGSPAAVTLQEKFPPAPPKPKE